MIVQTIALAVVIPVLTIALALTFFRLMRGPSLPDRVVALDLITVIGLGIFCAYALATGQSAFLDVALVVGLLGFLGTVAFAFYIERRA